MFRFGNYCLHVFVVCNLYGIVKSQDNTDTVCILKDAPTQCGAFCLAAQMPLLDHNDKVLEQLSVLAVLLNENQKETQKKLDSFETMLNRRLDSIQEQTLSMLNKAQEKLDMIVARINTDPVKILEPQAPINTLIPPGFELIGTRFFYIEHSLAASWSDAEFACRQKGGFLAAFQSEEEYRRIRKKLGLGWYWLGIKNLSKNGESISVASGKPAKIFNSLADNYDSNICALMAAGKVYGRICEDRNNYICQLDDKV